MKRLAVLCVLAAMLGVCSQSYGYVLVYDVYGQVKAIDTQTNTMTRTMVWGKLVVDMDEEQGLATAANLVLYNRNRSGQGVYTIYDSMGITIYGNSVAAVIDTSSTGGQIIMTGGIGRMFGINIGLGNRKNVASTLDGSIHFNGGILFETDQSLIGAGSMTATLNLQQTRDANRNSSSVVDMVDGIITRLQNRGFTELEDGGGGQIPG
jgi:hypothetical protein